MRKAAPASTGPLGLVARPRRRRLAVAVVGALAALALLAVLSVLGLRQMSRWTVFPGAPLAVPPASELAAEGLEPFDYQSADGVALRGVWAAPGSPDAPVVVYFHGNAESAGRNLDVASVLHRAGLGALIAEYRGYGGLEGRPSEEAVYRDGRAAVDALRSRGVEGGRVVLAGRSLGTGVAVELASEGLGTGLVLVSPYTSMVDMARPLVGPLAPFLVPDRFDSEAKAASIRAPAAVIHGTDDELVPFAMGERLARRLPRCRLVPVPGAGHNEIPGLAELIAREAAAVAAEAALPSR